MRMGRATRLGLALAAVPVMAFGVALAPAAVAAEDSFYKGKTLKVVIRTKPGGGYDFYGRTLARHMPKYIPGQPETIAVNMPGAGGIVATNYMANRAKRDGTEIAILPRGLAISQKLKAKGVNYDVRTLIPIGSAASNVWTWMLRKDHPVDSLAEMKKHGSPVKFSATGAGSGSYQKAKFLGLLGYPVKIITGYSSAQEKILAIARGEVDGTNSSYESLKPAMKEYGLKVIAKLGSHPELTDVKDARKVLSPKGRTLANFMAAPLVAGRPFFTTPDVPEARVKILRDAFRKALEDPQLLKEAEKAGRGIAYTGPEEMEEVYSDIMNADNDVVAEFRKLM